MGIELEDDESLILDDEIYHYYTLIKYEDKSDPRLRLSADETKRRMSKNMTISFQCFNPGLGFRKILNL